MHDAELAFDAARKRFYHNFQQWLDAGLVERAVYSIPQHLADLLGYLDIHVMVDDDDDNHPGDREQVMHILEMLNGEHGYVVYKLLIARGR